MFVQYHGGLIALVGGDTKDAVKRLTIARDNRAGGQAASDTYLRILAALAQANARTGDLKAAEVSIRDALRRLPQNPIFETMQTQLETNGQLGMPVDNAQMGAAEVFLNLGTAINREGGQQFARIYMQLASTLAPDVDAVSSELAELYDQQGLLLRANGLFAKIGAESPYTALRSWKWRSIWMNWEKRKKPVQRWISWLQPDPDDLILHLSYGAVLARHEKFSDAIGVYEKILKRITNPRRMHWNLYYRQGIAYERTKQWPLAEAAFKKALELFPNQPSVMNYLGYSWVDMDINLQEGLDMIRNAVNLRPNDGYMVDSLGWAYYKLGRMEEAVLELERAVDLRPGDPTINDHLGDAYWKAKRYLEATFQWKHALSLEPIETDIPRIQKKASSRARRSGKKRAGLRRRSKRGLEAGVCRDVAAMCPGQDQPGPACHRATSRRLPCAGYDRHLCRNR